MTFQLSPAGVPCWAIEQHFLTLRRLLGGERSQDWVYGTREPAGLRGPKSGRRGRQAICCPRTRRPGATHPESRSCSSRCQRKQRAGGVRPTVSASQPGGQGGLPEGCASSESLGWSPPSVDRERPSNPRACWAEGWQCAGVVHGDTHTHTPALFKTKRYGSWGQSPKSQASFSQPVSALLRVWGNTSFCAVPIRKHKPNEARKVVAWGEDWMGETCLWGWCVCACRRVLCRLPPLGGSMAFVC